MKAVFFVILFILSGCNGHKYVGGSGAKYFSENELREIRKHQVTISKGRFRPNMIVIGDIYDSIEQVGLYRYFNMSSFRGVCRLLKFKTHLAFYESDSTINNEAIRNFKAEYSNIFSNKELKEIEDSFLKECFVMGGNFL